MNSQRAYSMISLVNLFRSDYFEVQALVSDHMFGQKFYINILINGHQTYV